ncbi:MAG: hypothetical protein EOP05_11665 [Proteobacteria bacterium]|nr:MAG: hypothetical protein EOP05_11665 [Pseudomonadota bacterium]
MRILSLIVFTLLVQPAFAAQVSNANLLAIGQGISSPTSTSTVNYSSGYTAESPIGTIYQNGVRLTGEYDRNDNDDNFGAELGYGKGTWGVAAGYRKPGCDNCDGNVAGALGLAIGDFGVGIRFGEDLYSAAVLINPHGTHRFGIMGELNETAGSASKVTAYGVGYSYVASQFTFTLDASGRSFKDNTVNDDRIVVTPGLGFRVDIVQLTLNDRITLNRDENNAEQREDNEHDFWFGIGLGGERWHVAAYSDYVNELSVVGSLFF